MVVPDGWIYPKYNNYGQVIGFNDSQISRKGIIVNGVAHTFAFYSGNESYSTEMSMFAPTSSGVAGQVLVSAGNVSTGPTWVDFKDPTAYLDLDSSRSTAVEKFYLDCVENQKVLPLQIMQVDPSTGAKSYYLPSSTRYYERNVEAWLLVTSDCINWVNTHYTITDVSILKDVSTGTFRGN